MTRVLLIRHGETEWNRQRRWQGQVNVPLSPEGERQAGRLAERLREDHPDVHVVHSSDLDRAALTGRRIAAVLGCALVVDPAWREMDVGAWSGLSPEEIRGQFAPEWERILAGEDLPRGGGETFGGFTRRVMDALDALGRKHAGRTLAVVTHNGVVRALLLHLRGLPFSRLREIAPLGNTELAEIVTEGAGWVVRHEVRMAGPAAAGASPR